MINLNVWSFSSNQIKDKSNFHVGYMSEDDSRQALIKVCRIGDLGFLHSFENWEEGEYIQKLYSLPHSQYMVSMNEVSYNELMMNGDKAFLYHHQVFKRHGKDFSSFRVLNTTSKINKTTKNIELDYCFVVLKDVKKLESAYRLIFEPLKYD